MRGIGIYLGFGIVVAGVLGALFFFIYAKNSPQNISFTTATSTATHASSGISVMGPDGTSVTEVPNTYIYPSLDAPIVVDTSIPAPQAEAIRSRLQEIITELKANNTRVDLWLSLGITRLIAQDYDGAKDAWGVVNNTPSNITYIAKGNLGNLYMTHYKDYAKAEVYYTQAIALKPDYPDFYRDLFDLYTTYGYKKGTSAAADILAQGLKNNPGNSDLLALQAQLKAGN